MAASIGALYKVKFEGIGVGPPLGGLVPILPGGLTISVSLAIAKCCLISNWCLYVKGGKKWDVWCCTGAEDQRRWYELE